MPLEFPLAPMAHHLRQGMRIGQTLSQRPQKVEALGSVPGLLDADQAGVSTAPIGPE